MRRAVQRDYEERGKAKKQAEEDFFKSWDIYYRKFKNKSIKNYSNEFTITKNTNIDKDIDSELINYSCFYDSLIDSKVEECDSIDCLKLRLKINRPGVVSKNKSVNMQSFLFTYLAITIPMNKMSKLK